MACGWKRGNWTPVYKKDDKYSKENYWPITVQPCVDKAFEQLVGTQITGGFDGRMYEYSSAYRKAHSCETTLINLVEEWRLLGVTIDSKFSFTDHISTICKKASQRIGMLMRPRNLIPTKAKLMLFKSAVLLYLDVVLGEN